MLANNRRVRWLSASSPAQGGPETGGAIAYPVNAKGSLREIHAAQEVPEAGVSVEEDQAISMKELERDATDAVQELVGETRRAAKGLY